MSPVIVRDLGRRGLDDVWRDMKLFTEERDADRADELWFVEHPPVFTLGLNADRSHVLAPADIPVVPIDRGGQVTYHGPGQLVCYTMIDIKRRQLGIRSLVQMLESAVIDCVAAYGIEAYPRRDAPGVYVAQKKLAAVGLRVRRGCSYHGIAVNVDMELEPFKRINPCGFDDLEVTQIRALTDVEDIERRFCVDFEKCLLERLDGG